MPLSVRGLEESKDADEEMAERAGNLTPVLQVLAQDLKTVVDNAFDQSKSPGGAPWKPLAESTLKRRRSGKGRGPKAKPLIDTARLRNSANTRALPRAIQFGSNVEYAAAQQFGTGRIPARPFLPVEPTGEFTQRGPAEAWLREAEEAIANYIETGALPT